MSDTPPDWAPPPGHAKNLVPGSYWEGELNRYVSPGEDEWSDARYRQVLQLGVQPASMYDVVEQRGRGLLKDHMEALAARSRNALAKIWKPEFRRMVRYDTLWYRGPSEILDIAKTKYRHTGVEDYWRRVNLFQGRNVGRMLMTNMEVAGSAYGGPWALTHLRVVADFDENEDQLRRELARKGYWELVVAEQTQKMGFMEYGQWIPLNDVVPERQQFKVTVCMEDELHRGLGDLQCDGVVRIELHTVESRLWM